MKFLGQKERPFVFLSATFGILAATVLLTAGDVKAAQVEMASTLNPVGSGARAAGMGGAFIAVADDATAASWNPAGLVQLEKPEFSFVYGYFNRSHSYSSTSHPELDSDQNMDAKGINYASFVYPFTLFKRNMVISVNYQRLFDMNKHVRFNYNWDLPAPNTLHDNITFSQSGYLSTLTPAFAIQIIPQLYLGVAVNIWSDFFGTSSWESQYDSAGTGSAGALPVTVTNSIHNKYTFSGFNTTVGFMVILNKLTMGGVFKSPFSADIDQTTTSTEAGSFVPHPTTVTTTKSFTLEMPMSAGLGVQYRFTDTFLVSLDGYWTQWSAFEQKDSKGNRFNPITTALIAEGKPEDTFQAHLGGEYLILQGNHAVIPLRAGFFYDPEPGAHEADNFYGFSFGTGYTWDKYSFDIAYQYRWGNRVTGDIPVEGVSSDITQHTVLASGIYRF